MAVATLAMRILVRTRCVSSGHQVIFLEYSRFRGNDLTTPMPDFEFPGLNPGDSWCLCAERWLEAYEQDMAPRVYLMRTHKRALEIVQLEKLKQHAVDIN